jgi:hypothetical protein
LNIALVDELVTKALTVLRSIFIMLDDPDERHVVQMLHHIPVGTPGIAVPYRGDLLVEPLKVEVI